eukprot:SAG31_NODE_2156_length_6309_cov_30.741707_5_plen_228_part_00
MGANATTTAASVPLRAHPVLSLAVASGLHPRLGAESLIFTLPADVARSILELVHVDPIVVPGSELRGAWTDNARYYQVEGNTMRLRSVWWLDVCITANAVPRGRYDVILEITPGRSDNIACTVHTSPGWHRQYVWTRAEQRHGCGQLGALSLGTIELGSPSDVRLGMVNHDGHKSAIVWHRLLLVPTYRGVAEASMGWTAAESCPQDSEERAAHLASEDYGMTSDDY